MAYTISRTTICTECKEEHARRVVEILREKGYDIEYGEKTNLPSCDDQFNEDYYVALRDVGH